MELSILHEKKESFTVHSIKQNLNDATKIKNLY